MSIKKEDLIRVGPVECDRSNMSSYRGATREGRER